MHKTVYMCVGAFIFFIGMQVVQHTDIDRIEIHVMISHNCTVALPIT